MHSLGILGSAVFKAVARRMLELNPQKPHSTRPDVETKMISTLGFLMSLTTSSYSFALLLSFPFLFPCLHYKLHLCLESLFPAPLISDVQYLSFLYTPLSMYPYNIIFKVAVRRYYTRKDIPQ